MTDQQKETLEAIRSYPAGIGIEKLESILGKTRSRRTLQRHLNALIESGHIEKKGRGRSTLYLAVSRGETTVASYKTYIPLSEEAFEIATYVGQPVPARKPVSYDRTLLDEYEPNKTWYLDIRARKRLRQMGSTGNETRPAGTYGRAILDRLMIDLSWASSRLEGNTYTKLDTARLIELGETPGGRDASEAQMILNHKRAIELLVDDADEIGFNKFTFLNLHGLLSENLLPDPSASGRLRFRAVEIGGSVYQPTSVPQLIEESFDIVLKKADLIDDAFEQAFFVMLHIPYLQPFEDVNKRVSRIGANISLIKENFCPLTFLDVPEKAYVDGILGVYELGRFDLLRDVFVWAYERSVQQYTAVKRSMAEPDPLRLSYRQQLYDIVGSIVRNGQVSQIGKTVSDFADLNVQPEDRESFEIMALDDIKRLHIGVIARYRIRPSEFEEWKIKRNAAVHLPG